MSVRVARSKSSSMTMFLLVTTILSVPSSIVSMVMVYIAMFEGRPSNYINAYVCILHMVGSISAAGNEAWTDEVLEDMRACR